jgi:hypothetical protein
VWKGKKIRIKAWVPALLDTALDISSIHWTECLREKKT